MGSSQTMLSLMTLMIMSVWITSANGLSQQGCGKSAANIRVRVAGGKHSRLGMWPWQVSIHKQSVFNSARYNIMCGGTLIAPQWVLTAAHCFYTRRTSSSKVWFEEDTTSLKKYKIVAGEINTQIREASEQERFPTEVYIHPGYRHAPYYENDIALVKLNQTVTLSSLVRTVCLPISNVDFAKPGTVGTVAGWGKTKKSRLSTVLLHTTLEIQNNTVCDQATHYFFNRTVTFCAGDGKGNRGSCKGDSGGSLVRNLVIDGQNRWVAVGLVSWGVGCGLKDNFGYYTRIHPFVNWIKDTVKYSASSCANPGNILYGQLIGDHPQKRFANGTRIIYKCIDGYVLKGKSGRKCKSEGKWTSPPICVRERPCPVVRRPHNGVGRPSRGSYRYKAKIQFYCNRNHVMMGRSSITCQIDGKWNRYPPLCLASCSDPGIPKNGVRLGINFKHGQTVRFVCNKNTKMVGSNYVICSNGRWLHRIPKCYLAIGCGRPKPVPHASFTGTKFTIKYTCDKGYQMEANQWRTCKRNGKWTPKPRCVDYSPCGVSHTSFRDRMVGGNKAGRGTWPWQVGIYKAFWDGNLMLLCGGALINRQWVLTAAHCFYGQNEFTKKRERQVIPSNQYTITVGDDHLNARDPAQVDLEADAIYIHKEYKDHPKYENDIALVKLPKKVKLGPFVRTVCLPKRGEDLVVAGKHGYVAGWGVTQVLRPGQGPLPSNMNSKYLQHSAFSIQSSSTCAKTPFHYNNNVTFCAGSGMGGNGTCNGDAGGSFVREALHVGEHRWVSAGLVSWELGCGLKAQYGYYTRVEPFVDWIKKTMGDDEKEDE